MLENLGLEKITRFIELDVMTVISTLGLTGGGEGLIYVT